MPDSAGANTYHTDAVVTSKPKPSEPEEVLYRHISAETRAQPALVRDVVDAANRVCELMADVVATIRHKQKKEIRGVDARKRDYARRDRRIAGRFRRSSSPIPARSDEARRCRWRFAAAVAREAQKTCAHEAQTGRRTGREHRAMIISLTRADERLAKARAIRARNTERWAKQLSEFENWRPTPSQAGQDRRCGHPSTPSYRA
jgi:hypothetical protein